MKKIILIISVTLVVFYIFNKESNVKSVFSFNSFTNQYASFSDLVLGNRNEVNYSVLNNSNTSVMVRVKIKEKWVNSIGNKIVSVPNNLVLISINNNDWKYKDGYYYYKNVLNVGEESSKLINYIELNDSMFKVKCNYSDNGLEEHCSTDTSLIDNKQYILTFKEEFIDEMVYSKVWDL